MDKNINAYIINYKRDFMRGDYEDVDFVINKAQEERKSGHIIIYHYSKNDALGMFKMWANKYFRGLNVTIESVRKNNKKGIAENMTPAYIQKERDYIENMADCYNL